MRLAHLCRPICSRTATNKCSGKRLFLVVRSTRAGRVADLQAKSLVPMVLSVSGNKVFVNGANTDGLAVSGNGGFAIKGFGNNPANNPLFKLYTDLLQLPVANAEQQCRHRRFAVVAQG